MDLTVKNNVRLCDIYGLLVLTPTNGDQLPIMRPGQFVQVAINNSQNTFLRRPISINYVDIEANELWLLIRRAGNGTESLIATEVGNKINIVLPLGNGFSMPEDGQSRLLLVGGGVGVAPLLYLGATLKELGYQPEFILGARSDKDLLELNEFEKIGPVNISTEDGSKGEKGFVTMHSRFNSPIDKIYCCGPAPMMKAVATIARHNNTNCEVSLENMMACGLGACLCCVEQTVKGNVCVCTEGPVFNINQLTWHD
jgi:dihydroorotate dehydrogenase electron transfer subunit